MTARTWPCPISWPCMLVLVSLGLSLGTPAARAGPAEDPNESLCPESEQPGSAERYFSFVNRLDSKELQTLKHCLRQVVDKCSREMDRECKPGKEVLGSVFSVRRRELPDIILFMRRDAKGGLLSSRPVLQWQGKNTAHLFGSNNVWILVFAEEELPLEAAIVTIYQQTANPFAGLLPVIGVGSAPSQAKAAEEKDNTKALTWATISEGEDFYLGTARLPVGADSVNFVTVGLKESTAQTTGDASAPVPGPSVTTVARHFQSAAHQESDEPPAESTSEDQPGDLDPLKSLDRRDFRPVIAASAHFSNSRDSWAAFSVGFAQTTDVADTALGQGASGHLGAYAIAKIHILRPRIKAFHPEDKVQRRSRLSLSFLLGTNLQDDPFEEFVAGFSVGDILGKTGLLVGLNYTPFLETKENGVVVERFEREWKFIWGVEYTF